MTLLFNGNYRPVYVWYDEPFDGLDTDIRPDMTTLFAEQDFTLDDMSKPGFSYAGVYHRICWECDEGKDPHGNGPNYTEWKECRRGRRYVDVPTHPPSLTHSPSHSPSHSLPSSLI